MRGLLLLAICLFAFSSFQRRDLSARLEALDETSLASYYVQTPDPLRTCCYTGQQVIIRWDLRDRLKTPCGLALRLSIVTTKHTLRVFEKPIHDLCSYTVFRVANQALYNLGAILTYKLEMIANGNVITCWKQQGWVEWIDIPICE
jgi:hypothetical protein